METQLHYDISQSKQLSFKLKERITAKPDLEFKVKGLFNSVTGNLDYVGTLKKNFIGVSDESLGSTPMKIGLGVKTSSVISKSSQPVHLTASLHKKYSLLDGPNTILAARAFIDVDPKEPQKLNRQATIKASHQALSFTDKQDLKVAVGMDLDWPSTAQQPTGTLLARLLQNQFKHRPFWFKCVENNWGLHFRRNKWSVTYDM
eukprot:gene8733-33595_t